MPESYDEQGAMLLKSADEFSVELAEMLGLRGLSATTNVYARPVLSIQTMDGPSVRRAHHGILPKFLARRLRALWSWMRMSNASVRHGEHSNPSVWRRGRWYAKGMVSAASMAILEYARWPPWRPEPWVLQSVRLWISKIVSTPQRGIRTLLDRNAGDGRANGDVTPDVPHTAVNHVARSPQQAQPAPPPDDSGGFALDPEGIGS